MKCVDGTTHEDVLIVLAVIRALLDDDLGAHVGKPSQVLDRRCYTEVAICLIANIFSLSTHHPRVN